MANMSDVVNGLQHLLSEEGHIKRVTRESRKAVADSMAKHGLSPEEHAKHLVNFQGLMQESNKNGRKQHEQRTGSGTEKNAESRKDD